MYENISHINILYYVEIKDSDYTVVKIIVKFLIPTLIIILKTYYV